MKKSSTYLNNKKLILLTLLMLLSVGQGFAGGNTNYYARLTATTSATGKGLVYAATSNKPPTADNQYKTSVPADKGKQDSPSFTYYAWAKPARGYLFNGWSSNRATVGNNPTGNGDAITVSGSEDEKNKTDGKVRANWKEAPSFTITYKQPENKGQYSVRYEYSKINDNTFVDGKEEYTLNSTSGDKKVTSYANDVITLSSSADNFLGWYDGDVLLSKSKTINYSASKDATIIGKFGDLDRKNKVTFLAPTNGSYTATDGTSSVTNQGSITSNQAFTLKATPNAGYHVYGWYTTTDGGKTKIYFSSEETVSDYHFYENVSVGCDFSNLSKATFQIKGNTTTYDDLNKTDAAATAAGGGVIVLTNDGELLPGEYTISKGNTLLIPFDGKNTVYTTQPATTDTCAVPSCYRKLSLSEGANINVFGSISVGSQQYSTSNSYSGNGATGAPCGKYGCIDMSRGGSIVLNNGSNLYAWGFITGQNKKQGNNTSGVGTIKAMNGSNVYETFIIADYHGGGATSAMTQDEKKANFKVFPFNQYIIPNIEVPLTIESGATEKVVAAISSNIGISGQIPIDYISKDGGLFKIGDGATFKKWYDATADRQYFETTGDLTLNAITVTQSGQTLNSADYVLPLTNNISIIAHKGTLKVPNDVAIFAGSSITIGDDAIADASKNVYIFDADQWDQFGYNYSRTYYKYRPTEHFSPTGDGKTAKGLDDGQVVVNGQLIVRGNLYTTKSGADIKSNGNGKITFVAKPNEETKYVYLLKAHEGSDSNYDVSYNIMWKQYYIKFTPIPVTPALLHNASDALNDYTSTTGVADKTTFNYKNHVWTSETEPTFELTGNKLSLTKAYPVTADDIKKDATGKTYLSVDLTNANGPLGDAATLKNNVGAKTGNNILLYVSKNDAGTNITNTDAENNVVAKDSKGAYTVANFVVSDKQPIDIPTAFTAAKVSYNRTNTKNSGDTQWGTICLPFELTSGNGIQYYELKRVSGNTMTFERVDKVDANTPAIYSVASGVKVLAITGSGMNIAVTPAESNYAQSGFTLVGVQKKAETLKDGSNNYYIAQNKFWKPTETNVNVGPQRAYFQINGNSGLAKVFNIALDDGKATGIDNATIVDGNESAVIGIYSINGVKQTELRPGINIIKMSDGTTKKIIIK